MQSQIQQQPQIQSQFGFQVPLQQQQLGYNPSQIPPSYEYLKQQQQLQLNQQMQQLQQQKLTSLGVPSQIATQSQPILYNPTQNLSTVNLPTSSPSKAYLPTTTTASPSTNALQKQQRPPLENQFNFVYSVPKLIEPNPLDCVLEADNDLGGLYIGNLDAALSAEILKKNKIRAVLTTSVETGFRYAEESIHFHECLPAHDKEGYDITVHFEKGIEFIERNRKYTSVLVHCFAGVSRSASICIAYMMKKLGWDLEKALWHLKKCRRLINPNVGFIRKLTEYERYLQSGLSQQQYYQQQQLQLQQPQLQMVQVQQQQLTQPIFQDDQLGGFYQQQPGQILAYDLDPSSLEAQIYNDPNIVYMYQQQLDQQNMQQQQQQMTLQKQLKQQPQQGQQQQLLQQQQQLANQQQVNLQLQQQQQFAGTQGSLPYQINSGQPGYLEQQQYNQQPLQQQQMPQKLPQQQYQQQQKAQSLSLKSGKPQQRQMNGQQQQVGIQMIGNAEQFQQPKVNLQNEVNNQQKYINSGYSMQSQQQQLVQQQQQQQQGQYYQQQQQQNQPYQIQMTGQQQKR